MTNWQAYAKALTGAVVAGLSVILSGLLAGGLSWSEIVAGIIAFFVGLGAVYQIPNKGIVSETPPEPQPETPPAATS